ncbi:MAG: peptide-methionine (S)-S-oxide reductase MsrA [Bacteroidota bacterium]
MIKNIITGCLMIGMVISACSQPQTNQAKLVKNEVKPMENLMNKDLEIATLGGGCFWCVEAVYQDLAGVEAVVSGYSGGHVKNPTYEQITTKTTGHVEVVQVHFDPKVIGFDEILDVFWRTHNPTTLDQQGADKGPQYRSVVFYHNDTQKEIAEKSMKEAEAAGYWPDPFVTKIQPLINFYEAEDYHQDFYTENPNYGYCVYVIAPKLKKFRKDFSGKLKENAQ